MKKQKELNKDLIDLIESKSVELVIKFPNQEALKEFAVWLCESGEQQYWEWFDYNDETKSVAHLKVDFNYFVKSKTFMKNNVIETSLISSEDEDEDEEGDFYSNKELTEEEIEKMNQNMDDFMRSGN
jgi:hypothetical protein